MLKRNDNPAKIKNNLGETDDLIIAVISEINVVANVRSWVIDSGATRHIRINKNNFVSYTHVDKREDIIYFGDSRTTKVLAKRKSSSQAHICKTLTLSDVLHVSKIQIKI